MTEITWGHFDDGLFQRLCNSILYTQVSKRARLYSAPGRDGGIDQYYTGAWSGLNGKWRFQDKFKTTAPATAYSKLKTDLRNDIKDHPGDEDVIVYLTNISLLPAQETALLSIAVKALAKQKRAKVPTVLFWHHAILEAMIRTDPCLVNQFFSTGDPLLEDYRVFFQPQISATDLRYQLANPFIGRKEDLQKMADFLTGPQTMLVLTGAGNIGKTRMALQFFRQIIDADDDSLGLVLRPEGYSATSFARLLVGKHKLVILLDDAHRHLPILASIKAEVDKKGGTVKVILTTRQNLLPTVRQSLPGYARQLIELPLKPLLPTETKEMYRSLLPGQPESNLQWLRDQSGGVPGVIVAHCHHIRASGNPLDIPSDESFIDFVDGLVGQALKSVGEETSLPERNIREFIQIVALLGPLPGTDKSRELLSTLLDRPTDEVEEIGRALERAQLLTFKDSIAIKPDPVSDTILQQVVEKSPAWIKKQAGHPAAAFCLENIVSNLSALDIPEGNEDAFIRALLEQYINQITDPAVTEDTIRGILQTSMGMSFRFPDVAASALDRFFTIFVDPHHPLHNKATLAIESPLQKLKPDANRLLGRLVRTAPNEAALAAFFPLVQRAIAAFDETGPLYPCFGFTEFDFETSALRSGPCCHRQLFLSSTVKNFFISDDVAETRIALAAFDCLFKHDFQLEETFDPYTMQIFHGHGFVPNCSHTRQLRLELLQGITLYHRRHRKTSVPLDQHMDKMARVLLFFFSFKDKKDIIDQTEEVTLVMNYFSELLHTDASIPERAAITRYLHLGNRTELKPHFEDQHRLLEQLVKPAAIDQDLELFLTAVNHRSDQRKEKLHALVAGYPSVDLFMNALKTILTSNDRLNLTPLNDLAHFLGEHYLTHGRELLDFVIDATPRYLPSLATIADYFLSDEAAYFAAIERIWSMPEEQTNRTTIIGMLLTYRRRAEGRLHIKDLDYIAWAIADGPPASHNQLGYHLYRYADLNEERTFHLLNELSAKPWHHATGDIVYTIVEDKNFCARYKGQILSLFKGFLDHVELGSTDFGPALLFIDEQFDNQTLFSFVTEDSRIRSESAYYRLHNAGYRAGSYFDSCGRYQSFITWLRLYTQPLNEEIKSDLLRFFLPFRPVNEEQEEIFNKMFTGLIEKSIDLQELKDISASLQGYYPYDSVTLSLQCRLIDRVRELFPSFTDHDHLMGRHFLDNIEVGKTGIPAVEDIAKAAFLKDFLVSTPLSPPVKELLLQAEAKVRKDLQREDHPALWR